MAIASAPATEAPAAQRFPSAAVHAAATIGRNIAAWSWSRIASHAVAPSVEATTSSGGTCRPPPASPHGSSATTKTPAIAKVGVVVKQLSAETTTAAIGKTTDGDHHHPADAVAAGGWPMPRRYP